MSGNDRRTYQFEDDYFDEFEPVEDYDTAYDEYGDYEDYNNNGRDGSSAGSGGSRRGGKETGKRKSAQGKSVNRNTRRQDPRRKSAASRRNGGASAGTRRGRSGGSKGAPVLLVILMIVILCGAFGVKLVLDKYSYSKKKADLASEYGITGDTDVAIVWGNQYSDVRARLLDGKYYMALADVKKNLNDRFYYGKQNNDDTTGIILYALPDKVVSTIPGTTQVSVGQDQQTLDYMPARKEGDTVYLALDFVKQYTNFSYQAFKDPNRLQLDSSFDEQTVATVNKDTQIRISGGIKSDVMEELSKGAKVTILEKMDNWSKVKSEDAIIGYVENKRLSGETKETPQAVTDYKEPEFKSKMLGKKVNMAFHAVWGSQGNVTLQSYMAPTKDVNVVAPTWFWITSDNGDITSAAQQSYVDQVHQMGAQVWAVVDNFNSTELQDRSKFLATLDSRTHLIEQVIREATTYGIDGINVDFEMIDQSYGQDYIQFIRELSIACRANNLTLSVDDYPAYDFNSFYDIKEQGVFADYVVIMGYDEHYQGSQEAGSVASIGYVTEGITMALKKVPAQKLINAIPFYSRIWYTENGKVTSEAYGMQDIQNFISEHNMSVNWNAEAGQNYAETTEGDKLIQIWVEDSQSIKQKLDVMTANKLAGVAEWRLQFETADVWDVISNYMNQE